MRSWSVGLWLLSTACVEAVLAPKDDEFEGDGAGECGDDADNDRDGAFDCDDDGCAGAEACGADTDPAESDPLPVDSDAAADTDGDSDSPDDSDLSDDDSDLLDDDSDLPDDDSDTIDTAPPVAPEVFSTPGEFDVVVPVGVTSVVVHAWGGGGAGGSQGGATGGGGAYVSAIVPVTPGETLRVNVAEGGRNSGDGAGASWLGRSATPLVVAGGGGGGGSDGNSGNDFGGGAGGAGGLNGQDGQGLTSLPGYAFCTAAQGGGGGGQQTGGTGGGYTGTGSYPCNGQAGGTFTGGASSGAWGNCGTAGSWGWHAGGGQSNGGGGGGGSGWFGGGGAGFIWTYCGGGGGGGSSWIDPTASQNGSDAGRWQTQGNAAASQGAGRGGDRAWDPVRMTWDPAFGVGAHGRVELVW